MCKFFILDIDVYGMVDAMYLKFASLGSFLICLTHDLIYLTFELYRNSWLLEDNWERRMG